jgi:hypothetical protein
MRFIPRDPQNPLAGEICVSDDFRRPRLLVLPFSAKPPAVQRQPHPKPGRPRAYVLGTFNTELTVGEHDVKLAWLQRRYGVI